MSADFVLLINIERGEEQNEISCGDGGVEGESENAPGLML